ITGEYYSHLSLLRLALLHLERVRALLGHSFLCASRHSKCRVNSLSVFLYCDCGMATVALNEEFTLAPIVASRTNNSRNTMIALPEYLFFALRFISCQFPPQKESH
uniref:Uncharacterized protein n=1 Tax=Pristionchus pacificus TaxID=54126 RepID=A0A2A6CTS1_PRIPA